LVQAVACVAAPAPQVWADQLTWHQPDGRPLTRQVVSKASHSLPGPRPSPFHRPHSVAACWLMRSAISAIIACGTVSS